ncbi:hypothetical protein [Mesorhizobium sp. CAU 1741]|uniref:hypothetical protein n=1 Tax=Mesorhizobium sp. CAU 1741 TaxID=3140366 RepID=UPI00325B3ABB
MNQHILEKIDIVPAVVPIALTTARTGDVISMKNHGRCAVVIFKDAGTNGDDITVTVNQCTSVAASNAKALDFTRVDLKQGTLTDVGTWTTVTQDANEEYTNADLGGQQALIVIDIKGEDLDVANGYDCVRVSISDAGTNAQLGCALYLLHEPRYVKPGGVSAIAD